MSGYAIDFARVDDICALLESAGIRSADVDASKVARPGVWVKVASVTQRDRLGGYSFGLILYGVVADKDPRRAAAALQLLLNKVTTVADADGPITFQDLAMPDGAVLPSFAFPLDYLI